MEAWEAVTPDRGVDCSFCRSAVFHASQSVSSQIGIFLSLVFTSYAERQTTAVCCFNFCKW